MVAFPSAPWPREKRGAPAPPRVGFGAPPNPEERPTDHSVWEAKPGGEQSKGRGEPRRPRNEDAGKRWAEALIAHPQGRGCSPEIRERSAPANV
jgi:hypothetical protein